ncbi:MAG: ribbon-helix-helix protein, CopG family [Dehalococcoidia bacterium]|nr:ribbon-helix-helix protein, CopG family [Dehalococcoidia bacterium]
MKTSRITISLPAPLVDALDHRLAHEEESRSAVVRRILEQALKDAEEKEQIEQWIRGYTEHPQTEEEFGWSDYVTVEALKEIPWESKS